MVPTRLMIGFISLVALVSCGDTTPDDPSQTTNAGSEAQTASGLPSDTSEGRPPAPQITLGNGSANWIVVEGASRDRATLTFREVRIDGKLANDLLPETTRCLCIQPSGYYKLEPVFTEHLVIYRGHVKKTKNQSSK